MAQQPGIRRARVSDTRSRRTSLLPRICAGATLLVVIVVGLMWLVGDGPAPTESDELRQRSASAREGSPEAAIARGPAEAAELHSASSREETPTAVDVVVPPGSSLLRVRVRDTAGSAVLQGTIACTWSELSNVDIDTGAVQTLHAIRSPETQIVLPRNAGFAVVDVMSPGLSPARAEVGDLRFEQRVQPGKVQRRLAETEGADRVVDVLLGPEAKFLGVRGKVYVDDELKIPEGLRVLGSFDSGNPALAVLLRDTSEYVVCSAPKRLTGVWVTSESTEPHWHRFTDRPYPGETTLKLKSASAVRFHVQDSSTARPLSNILVRVQSYVHMGETKGAGGRRTKLLQSVLCEEETDSNGDVVFAALPRAGRATVTTIDQLVERGIVQREFVFELEGLVAGGAPTVLQLSTATQRVRVVLKVTDAVVAQCGGVEANVLPRFLQRVDGAKTLGVKRTDDQWSFSPLVGEEYEIWAECSKRTVSERITKVFEAADEGRSFVLDVAQPATPIRLTWSGAVGGSELSARISRPGAKLDSSKVLTADTSAGSWELTAEPGDEIAFSIQHRRSALYSEQIKLDRLAEQLHVELHDCQVRVALDAAEISGKGRLLLQSVDNDARRSAASLGCDDGVGDEPIALRAGEYFFRYESSRYPGLVVGVLTVRPGVRQVQAVAKVGLLPIVSACPGWKSGDGVELAKLEPLGSLRALVHDALRVVPPTPLGGKSDARKELWLPTSGASLAVR